MKNIYITGISGTGKTTITHILKEKGVNAIDLDEVPCLCFWISKTDKKKVDYEAKLDSVFINSHIWICDIEYLKNLLNTEDGMVVLGHAENYNNLLPLFDKVILLQCKPETFIKRIAERQNNDFGKEKTTQKYLLSVYNKFENDMLEKGAVSINTEEPLNRVVDNIIREIQWHPKEQP